MRAAKSSDRPSSLDVRHTVLSNSGQLHDRHNTKIMVCMLKVDSKDNFSAHISHIADEVEDDLLHDRTRSAFHAIETLAVRRRAETSISGIQKAQPAALRTK